MTLILYPAAMFNFVKQIKPQLIIMSSSFKETFTVNGEQLLKKIKELIAEGNVRKITIHDKTGKEVMSFPLTIGVVGAVLAPVFAAVGALAALIGECSISVEREE
jgi:hypothetical protein